jgi:hypothetical protein
MQEKERSPLSLLENMEMIDDRLCGCMVPVQETKDHRNMVYYKDLLSLSEDNCISVDEALDMTIKENCIPRKGLVVAIEEWRPLCNPEILTQFSDVVLCKEGTNSIPYKICDTILSSYVESGEDPFWLDVLGEACLNEEFALSLLNEDQYRMNTANLQSMINSTQHQINTLGPNNPQTANLQSKLKDMQSALNVRNNMAKSRASDRAGIPQNTATRNSSTPMTKEEQDAKKAEIRAKLGDKANAIPAGGTGKFNNTTNNSAAPQQQGWLSRMWSSIKNWWSNNFGNGNSNPATPTNKYAQAAAGFGQEQAQDGINRFAAWLSNKAQSKGVNADYFIDQLRQYASAEAPGAINKLMNYAQNKLGG